MKRHWLGFMLAMITPTIVINGHPMPGRWGRNAIPLPPGQHHLNVHLPYLLPAQIGPADLTIWLQPGTALEVEYRAPLWAYSRGALGPAPQPWNGKGCMITLLAVAGGGLALLLALVVITALSLS
ncbi:hypothetical protein ACWGH8_13860 [Nonomuraea muscovyensis]|uniref:Uncharacterized protein n=1 Tax=Nonomuraea muscovyensis TaxID=1124761 RepID=A0A7X0C0X4_9ACTN|nr:hypothetical protein [Nonomuraea muscovyensis]MBB6346435.1 hypothetical protein [Nonomuraea muscovyensis]